MIKICYNVSMSGAVASILEQTKSLTTEQKEEVGLYLLHNVKDNFKNKKSWQSEIKRRDQDFDGSPNFGISWEDIKKRQIKN